MSTEKKQIEVKSIMRSYRMKIKLVEAMDDPKINKNDLVNVAVEKELKLRGLIK